MSLNGFSRLPILYVNGSVGIISPEIVIVLPTYKVDFNVEAPLTSRVELMVVALDTDNVAFMVEAPGTTTVSLDLPNMI